MKNPNPANAGTFDVEQDHARLVIDVLGLDICELARAFMRMPTGRTSRTPMLVTYRNRVFLALRHARVDGDALSLAEIGMVAGGFDHTSIGEACRRAERAELLTQAQIEALRRGASPRRRRRPDVSAAASPAIPATTGEHA